MRSSLLTLVILVQSIGALPPTPPKSARIRQNINDYSVDQLNSLRRGVAVMKERSRRNPADPTGWLFQAAIHGTYAVPPLNAWNRCEHWNRFFLSWHRMYLYFFERILRKAAQDPNLTLPYWDYTDSSNQALPVNFRQPPTADNSLYEPIRLENTNAGGVLTGGSFDPQKALRECSFDGDSGFWSLLSTTPHSHVHAGVGGLMADPVNAALDPIFFLHHANIDRLWESWLRLGDKRTNPSDDEWLNQAIFTFYDEDGNQASMTGKDILDTSAQLRYRYDKYVEITPRQCTELNLSTSFFFIADTNSGIPAEQGIGLGNRLTQVTLSIAPDSIYKLADSLEKQPGSSAELILEGLSSCASRLAPCNHASVVEGYYEIYLNLPKTVTKPDPSFPEFIGLLSFFARMSDAPGSTKQVLSFDRSHLHILKDNGAFTLTFFRRGMELPGDEVPPRFKGTPSIGTIKIAVR